VRDDIERQVRVALASEPPNPLSLMILSEARGDMATAAQLGGLRQLERPGGGDFAEPLTVGFVEGLSPLEFFLSAFPARKTMVDKKLVVADAGTITRRLVEAAYWCVIAEGGACEDTVGLELRELRGLTLSEDKKLPTFERRLLGRTLLEPLPLGGETIAAGTILTPDDIEKIIRSGKKNVRVRSPLTCRAKNGLCQACYGWDPSTRMLPEIGLPVGVIAGQSVGERGTQLTMRTFHTGGVKGEDITKGLPRVERLIEGWADLVQFKVRLTDGREVIRDEQEVLSDVTVGHVAVSPEPVVEAGGRQMIVSHHLDKLRGLPLVHGLFSWLMHRIYDGTVDDRHLEVILRAMIVGGTVQGVTRAATQRRPGEAFLAVASFRSGLRVLARAALEDSTDPLVGYKPRLMLGKGLAQ
jgi:DNA-directed RNA polymerase subunit beta'